MPDAWDDDWVAAKPDNASSKGQSAPSSAKVSKAERRAKQAEFNKELWKRAEDPQEDFFLRSRDIVPLKSDFKPAMQVLSRKPKAKPASGGDSSLGIGQPGIEDDEDSEDEAKKNALTPQERQEKAAREREEKQKKYEEVRQKLFGSEAVSTPSSAPPAKQNGSSRNQSRGHKTPKESRPSSSASNKVRQLYDPNDVGKPGTSSVLKTETKAVPNVIQPIRMPRNPDNSGRGGFGFATRGGHGV